MAQLTGQQRVARGRYVSSCLTPPIALALRCSCISSSMRWPLLVSARNLERHQAALARIWRCFYLFSLHFAVVVVVDVVARKYLADWHDHAPCKCRTGAACITPTLTAALELHAAAFVVVFVF